jgi:TonB-linked SusC/RagA family outer membrane protein
MTHHIWIVAACAAGAVALPPRATAQTVPVGTVVGVVTDAGTKQGVPEAVVRIVNLQRVTRTDANGHYRLVNVPVGAQRVQITRLGYQSISQPVTVTENSTATVNFVLTAASAVLQQIVTVAVSGPAEQARVNGSQIGMITIDSVPKAPITNFSELLNSRVPGLVVQLNSGEVGTGARIVARGEGSPLLSNEPLIVIDGIRAYNNTNNQIGGVGGQTVSRFDDFDFENIDNVQILRGPAAAALYGTEAAAGVIVITTRKGNAGEPPRWHFHANLGQLQDVNGKYPSNYGRLSDSAGAGNVGPDGCSLIFEYAGLCTGANGPGRATAANSYDLVHDSSLFKRGYDEGVGLSVEGGTQTITYYTGVDWDRQQGVYADNSDRFTHVNGGFTVHPSQAVDLNLTTLYTQRRIVLPFSDNNVGGVLSGALLGGPGPGQYLNDGFHLSPSNTELIRNFEDVDRYTMGGSGTVRLLPWLTARGNAGVDYIGLFDHSVLPPIAVSLSTTPAAATDNAIYEYTGATSLSAKYPIPVGHSLDGTTTIGGEWVDVSLHSIFGGGQGILPGSNSVNGATSHFTATETNTDVVNIGGYLQQQIAWRNVLFLSVSGRLDGNSAFGRNNSTAFYPSGNVSYVVSDEDFWPRNKWVSSVRLRFAAGQSGREPTFRLAQGSLSGVAASITNVGNDQVGAVLFSTANPDLKPERSTEYEAGLDVSFWKDRFNLAATVYDRTEKDLVEQPPTDISTGVPFTTTNLGSVDNRGLELTFSGDVYRSEPITVTLGATFDLNRNKLTSLGPIQNFVVNNGIVSGVVQQNLAGQPLGVFTSVPYTYSDLNHDGVIEPNEIKLGTKPVVVGEPGPREELTLSPTITLFRYFRINAQFDRRDGMTVFDGGDDFRCTQFFNGRECNDPHAPLKDQAAAVAGAFFGTDYGYLLNGSFWKVRELSLAMIMPDSWARYLLGGRAASLTLAARNVATWSPYRGLDPEINEFGGQVGLASGQFLTQPPVRVLTARVDITW